jgi:uncharacterized protein YbjT (DUF2867 family)
MKIIVFGGAGMIGSAIAQALRGRGHQVVAAGRRNCDVAVDYRYDQSPQVFEAIVRGADIVVNAAGILIERGDNTFDAVHLQAPSALFAACAAQRVARVVHVSAAGLPAHMAGQYAASKRACERTLEACLVDYAIVQPSLVVDAQCPSTRLMQCLAKLPVIALPGLLHPGASTVAPLALQDLADAVARICEHPKALRRSIGLAGPEAMPYKTLLQRYRSAAGKGPALWLPMPWWLMKLGALAAAWLPQSVYSIDTMRMLQNGAAPQRNEAAYWLRRAPRPVSGLVDAALPELVGC